MNTSDYANVIVSITSVTALFIAIYTFWFQNRQAKRHLGIQILEAFGSRFFFSEELLRLRYKVCKYYKENGLLKNWPPEVWRLADEFGMICYYVNKGLVNKEDAWVGFFYWLDNYFYIFKDYFVQLEDSEGVDYLYDFKEAHRQLALFGKKNKLPDESYRYSQDKINQFINDEMIETFDKQWEL